MLNADGYTYVCNAHVHVNFVGLYKENGWSRAMLCFDDPKGSENTDKGCEPEGNAKSMKWGKIEFGSGGERVRNNLNDCKRVQQII